MNVVAAAVNYAIDVAADDDPDDADVNVDCAVAVNGAIVASIGIDSFAIDWQPASLDLGKVMTLRPT